MTNNNEYRNYKQIKCDKYLKGTCHNKQVKRQIIDMEIIIYYSLIRYK